MKILEIQEHIDEERTKQSSKFGSFLNSFLADILLFSAALVAIIIMLVVIYIVYRQSKLKTLVANIALQHVKGIKAAHPRYEDIHCECKMQWYIVDLLLIILLGMAYLVTNKINKSNLFGGCLFSNVTKVKLFVSNMQSYMPINVCKISCISQEQLYFWILDKLLPVSNMASSRSEENVNLNYFTNWWCHSYGETCNFFNVFVRTKLADVIANGY